MSGLFPERIHLPIVAHPPREDAKYFPFWEIYLPLVGKQMPRRGVSQGLLFVSTKIQFLDFIEESFVAYLQELCRPFSIPIRLTENLTD